MLPRLWGHGKLSSVDFNTIDYLKDLGVSHLWLTGILRHASGKDFVKGNPGSPYSICDYYDINPYLADNEDRRFEELDELIARCHDRGLKVLIDFVPNHISRDYCDSFGGIPHFDYCDYDWTDTLKINYGHPDTYNRMLNILLFWASKGIDGFRCDMVELVNPHFFSWLIFNVKKQYTDIVFIAEVYQKERYKEFTEDAGFDYLYDKSGLYDVLRSVVCNNASSRTITWNWQSLQSLQPKMLNFLENHDEQRLASPWFSGRSDYYALLYPSLLFNTSAFMIYFGQELGVDASEGCEGRTSIFNWTRVNLLDNLWNEIHSVPSLDIKSKAVLNRYRELLNLASGDLIASGLTYDLCYCQEAYSGFNPDKHFAFIRKIDDKTKKFSSITFLFACNFDNCDAEMSILIPKHAISFLGLISSSDEVRIKVSIPARDGVYFPLELQ